MVRRRSNRAGRGRNSLRTTVRKLHSATLGAIQPIRLSPDPPIGVHTRTFTVKATVQLLDGTKTSFVYDKATSMFTATILYDSKTDYSVAFPTVELAKMYCYCLGIGNVESHKDMEIAIDRVALWGPLPQQNVGLVRFVRLAYDDSRHTKVISDVGSGSNRARCGLTIPYRYWSLPSSAESNVRFHIATSKALGTGTTLGTIQITITGRSAVSFTT